MTGQVIAGTASVPPANEREARNELGEILLSANYARGDNENFN